MAGDLAGKPGQYVALYVPLGTEEVYKPDWKRGRVIGIVELLPMPAASRMEDYFYDDWDGTRRWPLGWPCRVICSPSEDECPVLREHVESLHGPGSFKSYATRFAVQGPFCLEPEMSARLDRDFARFLGD
jgi:hypothetical protein